MLSLRDDLARFRTGAGAATDRRGEPTRAPLASMTPERAAVVLEFVPRRPALLTRVAGELVYGVSFDVAIRRAAFTLHDLPAGATDPRPFVETAVRATVRAPRLQGEFLRARGTPVFPARPVEVGSLPAPPTPMTQHRIGVGHHPCSRVYTTPSYQIRGTSLGSAGAINARAARHPCGALPTRAFENNAPISSFGSHFLHLLR